MGEKGAGKGRNERERERRRGRGRERVLYYIILQDAYWGTRVLGGGQRLELSNTDDESLVLEPGGI